MKNGFMIIGLAAFCLSVTLSGCSKEKVRRKGLEGSVYEVISVSHFDGVSQAGWINSGNTDPSEGGIQSATATGTWDFTDLENIVVDMAWTTTVDGVTSEAAYAISGALDMIGNDALFIGIESDLDYGFFPVHERKGKNLVLVYAEGTASYEEYVTFVTLKR